MFKKRAMAEARWVSELADQWITEINMKRLETGYADNQPKYPYWVKPLNYSADEWLDMSDWIIDTMGYSDWSIEHGRWIGSDRKYWFRDERDRTMFILRWS
jgi:hypothetical protein